MFTLLSYVSLHWQFKFEGNGFLIRKENVNKLQKSLFKFWKITDTWFDENWKIYTHTREVVWLIEKSKLGNSLFCFFKCLQAVFPFSTFSLFEIQLVGWVFCLSFSVYVFLWCCRNSVGISKLETKINFQQKKRGQNNRKKLNKNK